MKEKEEEIIELFRADKEKGFRCLINYFQEPIYWHIRRMLDNHDDTEDVLQETFLRVYKHWKLFKRTSKLSTWIYKIATNEVFRFLEHNKQTKISIEDVGNEIWTQLDETDDSSEELERTLLLEKAIRRLPERQQLVFNLRYYDRMEYSEMAVVLNTQIETLKTNFFYAKENIKKYLQTQM